MIDLKKRFGQKYRIFMDEAWYVETTEYYPDKIKHRPWYYEIRGKYGAIYLYGTNKLAVRITANRVKTDYRDIFSLYLEAEDENIFLCNPEDFVLEARLTKARRKKQVTEKERLRLRKISRLEHYKKQNTAQILAQTY